jgi:hypothetical protein
LKAADEPLISVFGFISENEAENGTPTPLCAPLGDELRVSDIGLIISRQSV